MARTQEQIRKALENCTVAPREAAAALLSDATKGKPENRRKEEVEFLTAVYFPETARGSSGR
jgi:hypothetical protein